MNSLEILKEVKALLSNPENWIKGHSAEDIYGYPVHISDPRANKFCLIGAFGKIGQQQMNFYSEAKYYLKLSEKDWAHDIDIRDQVRKTITDAEWYIRQVIKTLFLSEFNDTSTHEEIILALDKAILMAEKDWHTTEEKETKS